MNKKAIFTTKYVVENNATIIYVIHDSDGDWQFFSEEDASEKDARIISFDEILELDPSLKSIIDLPKNMEAYRDERGKEWTTKIVTD